MCRGDGPRTANGTVVWWLTQEQLAEWERLYPGLSVIAEARKALAWTRARPANRKTWTGYPAFLTAWLNKAANARPPAPVVSVEAQRARAESERRERAARNGTRSGEPAAPHWAQTAMPRHLTPEQRAELEAMRADIARRGTAAHGDEERAAAARRQLEERLKREGKTGTGG